MEAGTRVVQYGYAGADGADVADVVDRAQAEIYDVTERRTTEDFVVLEHLLQPTMDEIDAIASQGGIARGVPTGFTELDEVTNGLHPGQMIVVAARPGVGKALALDTPLPTPTGWTTMGEVAVGDELIGADGAADARRGGDRGDDRAALLRGRVLRRHGHRRGRGASVAHRGGHPHHRRIAQWRRPTHSRHATGRAGGTTALLARGVSRRLGAAVDERARAVRAGRQRRSHLYLAGEGMVPTHNSTLGLGLLRSCSIKHRHASVIFSLEMSKSEIVMRLLSAEAKIKLADMRSGRMSDDDWTRLARRMSEISEAPLYIDDSPNLTMMEIRAKARRLHQKADLRLIVVDYLQLMTSGKKVESRQQEVSEFSRQIKLLAKELEVPVVAISQLNRGPEQRTDKKPDAVRPS